MEGREFILELAVVLACAMAGGYVARKLKQPSVLGQIVAGIIVGPSVLGIDIVTKNPIVFHRFADIGVIMLMFIAGLETDVEELKESGKSSTLVALGGVVFPLVLGTLVAYYLMPAVGFTGSIFVGIILTATSVSLTVQVLREMGCLRCRQGVTILGAAIIDDVLGIILVSVVIGIVNPSAGENILFLVGKILLFFMGTFMAGFILNRLITRMSTRIQPGENVVVFAIILCFLLAFLSELSAVAAITGAYVAGLILSTTPYQERIASRVQVMAYGIFTPIFFVNLGITVKLQHIGGALVFGILVALAAIVGKVLGCGLGAKLSGFGSRQSLQVGVGMIPRAEVALIVANLGLQMKVIGEEIFAAVIILVLVTTLITPPLLKLCFSGGGRAVGTEYPDVDDVCHEDEGYDEVEELEDLNLVEDNEYGNLDQQDIPLRKI